MFQNTYLPIGIQIKTRIIRYIRKAKVGAFADTKRAITNKKSIVYGTDKGQYAMVKYRKR